MLVTVYKDSQSSILGAIDDEAIRSEPATTEHAALKPSVFAVEVPWTPESGALMALLLIRWRQARPTRAVMLTFADDTAAELLSLSSAQLEWVLPTVKQISIIDVPPQAAG